MYKHSVAALALLASVVSAQSTTTLYLIGFDQQPIDASIVGSDASATTYSLSCPTTTSAAAVTTGYDDTECGVPTSMLITQGPSTLHYSYSAAYDSTTEAITIGCDISGTTSALCTATEILINGTISTSTVDSTSFTGDLADPTTGLGAVTVTVLGSATGATIAGSSATTSSSKATAKATGTSSGASATGSSTSTSTGGVPMVTGNAKWVVGGAAAAAGFALAGF